MSFCAAGYPYLFARGLAPNLSDARVAMAKAAVGVFALVGALVVREREAQGRPLTARSARAGAVLVGVMSVLAYLNFGVVNGWPRFVHTWDVFHYYLGAKYQPELGYDGLYSCSLVAEAESSPTAGNTLRETRFRDLRTGEVRSTTEALRSGEACRARFSPSRWSGFVRDVAWFRMQTDAKMWSVMHMDHGYQPPPSWSVVGGGIARAVPTADAAMRTLAAIDIVLLAGCLVLLRWAFGARAMWVGLVFLGTQWPANAFFMVGNFLRNDWLLAVVAAVCLSARRRFALAGAVLALGTALRVVPVFFVAGWLAFVLARVFMRRPEQAPRCPRGTRRFGVAFAVTLALTLGLTASQSGIHAYARFYENLRRHHETPLVEHMGMPVLFSHVGDTRIERTRDILLADSYQSWREERARAQRANRGLFLMTLAVACVGLVAASRRLTSHWGGLLLGVVLVTLTVDLACYYYSMFVVLAALARAHRGYGLGLIALGTTSSLLVAIPAISASWDERFAAQSMLYVGATLLLLLAWARSGVKRTEVKPALS